MNFGKTIFAQVMEYLPMHEFHRCVDRHDGSYKVQQFSCYDHFLCMAFAQLTYRESLRDTVTCLQVHQPKLYHMGFRGRVVRSTLSHANNTRPWQIYAEFARVLIHQAQELYRDESFAVELSNTVYAFDSTTIDLCISLFPWATFRTQKAAIKLHTLLNLQTNIPSFLSISKGNMHDVRMLDELHLESGAIYVLDKAYIDFARLYHFTQAFAFFVTRAKSNLRFHRLYSHAVEKSLGTLCDQTIRLVGVKSHRQYPDKLRRIKFVDVDTERVFVFLTNNFLLPAPTIAQLYKCRWQIELFFRWIKQHLRIKSFFGTTENAVRTQIWIAISVYVVVAIIKKRLNLGQSLYTILQILSISALEKTPILQALTGTELQIEHSHPRNQLNLFHL